MSSDETEPFMSSGSEYVPSDSDLPSTSRGKTKKVRKQVKKCKKVENITSNNQDLTPVVNRRILPNDNSSSRTKKGKKRMRNEALWQRNIRKVKKAAGEEYTTVKSGKLIPVRKVGNDCACRLKCFSKINVEERNQVLKEFNGLANKEKQDLYLGGLIRVDKVARKRSRTGTGKAKTVTFHYKIRVRGTEYIVCRQAFCSIHGITRHRTNRIGNSLKENIAAPLDMRGKHENRPNKIPQNIIATIDNHILSFPKRSSHYSREKNERRTYLSSDLNISKMHKLYLERYEPDVFEKLESGEKCQPKVSYDFYFRHFRENYNISFGSPRSDTCQTCDRLENLIAAEQDREAKHVLQTEKAVHIRKAEVFYTSMKEKTQLANTDETVEVLCFDYQQNLPLPHVPAGDVFYKRQLWQYNFCIFSGKTGLSTFYMYDEATSKQSSNEVISFLHHYITTFLPDSVTTLYLFSDNSFAQNKNHKITKYLFTLVNQRIKHISQVIHQYPEPGHSFLPCDRSFGLIEREKRRRERVYVPAEWKELVRKTSKKFRVIDVTQDIIMNFSEHFKPMFRATFTSQNTKTKFSISTFRLFKYQCGSNFIECSPSVSLPLFTKFSATKLGCELSLPTTKMVQIYPLPMNEKKLADVKLLVKKYVPEAYHVYYRIIFGEVGEAPEPQPPEEAVDTREDAAYESDSSYM